MYLLPFIDTRPNHPSSMYSNHMFFLLYKMIQFNKMSSLFKSIPVRVPKKQIAELNSRLKKETHELEHKQLVEALRRINKLEEEVVHLNKLVHAWPPSETASEKKLDGFDIWVRQIEHKQLVEALRRITKLEEEVVHLNNLVHARMHSASEKKPDGFDIWVRQKLKKEKEEAELKSPHIQRKKGKKGTGG